MISPTKTQRTAAAKALLKESMLPQYDSRTAHRGYVHAAYGKPTDVVLVGNYGMFIGNLPDGILQSPDPANFMDWKSFVKDMTKIEWTRCDEFEALHIQSKILAAKATAHDAGKKYEKARCVMRYTLPSGEEIGLNCERLLSMCKLVGPLNQRVGLGWYNEPVLKLPQRPIDPVKIIGEYGTAYLLPVRL